MLKGGVITAAGTTREALPVLVTQVTGWPVITPPV